MGGADLQFSDDLVPCPVTELSSLSSKGRIANDGQQTCVDLLGAGLTREKGAELGLRGRENGPDISLEPWLTHVTLSYLIPHDVDDGGRPTSGTKQVQLIDGLQCSLYRMSHQLLEGVSCDKDLGHSNRGSIKLCLSVVCLISSLPYPVVLHSRNIT